MWKYDLQWLQFNLNIYFIITRPNVDKEIFIILNKVY